MPILGSRRRKRRSRADSPPISQVLLKSNEIDHLSRFRAAGLQLE